MPMRTKLSILTLALLLTACERKSEVTIADSSSSSSVTTPRIAVDTTMAVQHDTTPPAVIHDTVVAPRPSPTPTRNIRVDMPQPGQRIIGPMFPVNGMSRTFENGIAYKLVSATGAVLASGHGTTHGSMGEFGPYDFIVSTNNYNGKATLQVFDYSAKDGKEIDKVSIPLILGKDTIGIRPSDRLPVKK